MEFCPDCDNYLALRLNNDSKSNLMYECKNCKFTTTFEKLNDGDKTKCVYSNPYNIDKLKYILTKKEFIKYDPTYPHIDCIPCPNDECSSNKDSNVRNDIIFIEYNRTEKSFLYICNNCAEHWTNNHD
jgi:hypothetical protein